METEVWSIGRFMALFAAFFILGKSRNMTQASIMFIITMIIIFF